MEPPTGTYTRALPTRTAIWSGSTGRCKKRPLRGDKDCRLMPSRNSSSITTKNGYTWGSNSKRPRRCSECFQAIDPYTVQRKKLDYRAMDSDVQKEKDRVNIAEVVGAYVTLREAGRTYTARCPFHNERTPSFHVSPERGTYKCFGCGEGGDVFTFVQKMDGVDFPTALKQLA